MKVANFSAAQDVIAVRSRWLRCEAASHIHVVLSIAANILPSLPTHSNAIVVPLAMLIGSLFPNFAPVSSFVAIGA